MARAVTRLTTAVIGIALIGFAGVWSAAGRPAGPAVPAVDSGDTAAPSPADVRLLQDTIEAVNAQAGRTPAAQRAVLQRVVEPDRAADQRDCSPAATTVRFEPAWADLRPDPNGGTGRFVLPTLIRIYTDQRITGTDTAALIMSISDGSAHLPPLCVA